MFQIIVKAVSFNIKEIKINQKIYYKYKHVSFKYLDNLFAPTKHFLMFIHIMRNHIKFDNTLIKCEYFISCEVRRLYQLPMIQ